MNKKPGGKISLNLGGLKLGSSSNSGASTSSQVTGFGTFGTASTSKSIINEAIEKEKDSNEVDLVAESNDDMAKIMGFSGFGDTKKAKQFDMSKILEDAKNKARERNATNNQALEAQAAEMAIEKAKIAPVKESKAVEKPENSDSDSDDDFIGPPIPVDIKNQNASSENKPDEKVKSDYY